MAVTPISPVMGAAAPKRTDSLRGLAFMGFGLFLFAAVDAQAKFLTDSLHPIQIVWSRQLGLLVGVLILLALRGPQLLKTTHLKLQVTRGVLAACSATMFVVGVAFVPLADAVAVSFVAPFMVTVMGALFLGEKVGIRRWVAVSIGFLATLIIIRPGLGVIHPAAFVVMGAAACFALRQIVSRALSGQDPVRTTVAYTALVGCALLTLPLPFVWQTPKWGLEIGIICSMTVMAAVAEVFVIKALEVAEAVVVAPVQYTMLLWGVIYGWFIFGQLPDLWTWVGALIIVATGIYTLNRERIVARQRRQRE